MYRRLTCDYTVAVTMIAGPGHKATVEAPGEEVLSIRALLQILRKWLWVIVLVPLLLAGLVVGASFLQTPQYAASIKILVGQDQGISQTPQDAMGLQSITLTMAEAVNSRRTAEAVIERLDLRMSQEDFLENLNAEQIPETQFVQVDYVDPDPKRAQRIANAVGAVFSEQVSNVSPEASAITATVWEMAELPDEPESPNPVRNGFLALMLGTVLGVGLAFLLEYLDDRWQSPEEAESVSGVPTYGVIPEFEVPRGKGKTQEQQEGYS